MSDEEVDELLKIADTSSGEVNYTGRVQQCGHLLDGELMNSQSSSGRYWQIEQTLLNLASIDRIT